MKKISKLLSAALVSGVTAIGLGLFTPQIASAFGIGVQPSTVEMTIKPGDRQRQVITIGNVHKSKTITMTMGLADWSLDKNGQLELAPPGDTARSAADWVRFSPATVTLKPETSQDVVVEITAPAKVAEKGDHRFALLATTMLPELDKRGDISGVWNRYQLASLFYLTFTPSESTPVIDTVSYVKGDAPMLTMSIRNEGTAHARLQGNAIVKDASGEIISETPLSTVVLDRHTRDYAFKLAGLEELDPGTYDVAIEMENIFVPQNKFKNTPLDVKNVKITTD